MPQTHFDLFVRATFDIDDVSGPDFVGLRITADWLAMQIRRNAAFCELDLTCIEAVQLPLHIDEASSEVSFSDWHLQLDRDSFRFVGKADGGGNTRSDWVSIADAQAVFNAMCGRCVIPPGFEQYGGAVFYSDDDVEYLIENVTEALPAIEAMETHLKMAEVIEAETKTAAPTAAAARRRPSV